MSKNMTGKTAAELAMLTLPNSTETWLSVYKRAATKYGLPVEELVEGARRKSVASARHDAWLELREAGYSFPEIGRGVGFDHTTIMGGVAKAKARLKDQVKNGVELGKTENVVFAARELFSSNIRPKTLAMVEGGRRVTLKEWEEFRGNSWEHDFVIKHLDEEALCHVAIHYYSNCSMREQDRRTYNGALIEKIVPLLVDRLKKLSNVMSKLDEIAVDMVVNDL